MEWLNLESVVLLFVLGLRHGLDPDHIALIDNITLKSVEEGRWYSRWIGSFFAFGHGLTVTIISLLITSFAAELNQAKGFFSFTEWLPVLLLFIVGCANLHQLLKNSSQVPSGRLALLPKRWNIHSNPVFIVFVGMLFALVFDTTTQAAAWGYAASTPFNTSGALVLGVIFTSGMMLSDTLDSNLLSSVLKNGLSQQSLTSYRRNLGWMIVTLSFTVVAYQLMVHFNPALEMNEQYKLLFGLLFLVFVLVNYLYLFIKKRKYGY